jgi:RimJ/RimL family protein N-acetyltransferase
VQLRPLAEPDLETIRLLRNRDRHAFFDNRAITPEAQRQWFAALRATPVEFFVIEDDGRVVGTISVTTTAEGKEIGNLVLDAACRGRGLVQRAVTQLTTAPARYFARVKAGNTPSQRVFRATGFTEQATASESVFEKTVS